MVHRVSGPTKMNLRMPKRLRASWVFALVFTVIPA